MTFTAGAVLGQGTSAKVFEATSQDGKVRAALKKMETMGEDFAEVARREFQLLRSLSHPGVIKVLDFGVTNRCGWFAMELMDRAQNLAAAVAAEKAFSEALTAAVLAPLAAAVGYLHSRTVSHRDIKP